MNKKLIFFTIITNINIVISVFLGDHKFFPIRLADNNIPIFFRKMNRFLPVMYYVLLFRKTLSKFIINT